MSAVQPADCTVGTKMHMGSRDGRDDGDGVFNTAAVPVNIVTTVTSSRLKRNKGELDKSSRVGSTALIADTMLLHEATSVYVQP